MSDPADRLWRETIERYRAATAPGSDPATVRCAALSDAFEQLIRAQWRELAKGGPEDRPTVVDHALASLLAWCTGGMAVEHRAAALGRLVRLTMLAAAADATVRDDDPDPAETRH